MPRQTKTLKCHLPSKVSLNNFKCKGCGQFAELDEYDLCDICSQEDDWRILDVCERCDLHELLVGGICSFCEKDGVRCEDCDIWMRKSRYYFPGIFTNNFLYLECNKCSSPFCSECYSKHLDQSCWNCSKIDCPKFYKICKLCKNVLCSECGLETYCSLCWIMLITRRNKSSLPRDILKTFIPMFQCKIPNELSKTKCEHNKPWGIKKCKNCNTYMCLDCRDEHQEHTCAKCELWICGNKFWRSCYVCSRTICTQCPSGSVGNVGSDGKYTCSCKEEFPDWREEFPDWKSDSNSNSDSDSDSEDESDSSSDSMIGSLHLPC